MSIFTLWHCYVFVGKVYKYFPHLMTYIRAYSLYFESILLTFSCDAKFRHCCIFLNIDLRMNLIERMNYKLTCFTDPFALCVWFVGCCVWFVSCCVLVNTHQPLIAVPQIVPRPSTGFPLCSGTYRAAATDTCRDTTFALELQGLQGGAVYPLAGRAVKGLKLLSCSCGCILWPQRPQHSTQKEQHPHPWSLSWSS